MNRQYVVENVFISDVDCLYRSHDVLNDKLECVSILDCRHMFHLRRSINAKHARCGKRYRYSLGHTGGDFGCKKRQDALNKFVPYSPLAEIPGTPENSHQDSHNIQQDGHGQSP